MTDPLTVENAPVRPPVNKVKESPIGGVLSEARKFSVPSREILFAKIDPTPKITTSKLSLS